MPSRRGFFAGLHDFLAAPFRLWFMHKRLVELNPQVAHLRNAQRHHLERQRRLHLREKLMECYSRPSDTSASTDVACVDVVDSDGLFQPLLRMWLINVGLILCLALISQLLTLIGTFQLFSQLQSTFPTLAVISWLMSGLLRIWLPLFMELVNMLYLKKICDRVALLKGDVSSVPVQQSGQSGSTLGAMIMDRIYTLIFFVLFQLEWTIICHLSSNYPVSHLINIFSVAFLYACYAVEYRWRQLPGRTFEGFLVHILDRWTYFVGYGLILGLGCQRWPEFIGSGGMFLSVTYPVLVIGALGARHPRSADELQLTWLEQRCVRLFRFPLVLSMHLPLFCTNLIVRGCVGAAYQLWF